MSTTRLRSERLEVRTTKDERSLIDRAVAAFGGIDVLCNHVGGSDPRKDLDLLRLDLAEWDRAMALNARSTVIACRLAIPVMVSGGAASSLAVDMASAAGMTLYSFVGPGRGNLHV